MKIPKPQEGSVCSRPLLPDRGLCCDPDDPCFCPVYGPSRRPVRIRYTAHATQQVRRLSNDPRWPLRAVEKPA